MRPAEEERTGAMKGNKNVKMGIGGEGVKVGEEKRQRRLERKGELVEHNILRDVNTTRGDMQTLITFMRSR